MEAFLQFIAIAWSYSTFLLFIVVFIVLHQRKKTKFFHDVGVECEPTWPIVGAFPTIHRQGILEHDIFAINQYGAVHGSYLGNIPTLVVADPVFIREILVRQSSNFPYRMQALYISKWWQNGVVIASGEHWRYLRSLISPSFSSGKLREMQPRLLKCINVLTDCLYEKTGKAGEVECDLRTILGALTMDIICSTSFGIEMETLKNMESEFTKHAKVVSTLNIESNPVNALPLIIPSIRHVFEFLDLDYVNKTSLNYVRNAVAEMIAYRKTQTETHFKDTLHNLMNAHKGQKKLDINGNIANVSETGKFDSRTAQTNTGHTRSETFPKNLKDFQHFKEKGLTDDELAANALIILMAGYDTTATTLTWMCYLLAMNPNIQDTLVGEIDNSIGTDDPDYECAMKLEYLDWFLCETLRLYPAANRTGRDACVDTSVCGCKIPKGLSVTVPIFALHRMPKYWSEPEKCIPERFSPANRNNINPYVYIPFGVGPRACVGIRMAQLMCKIVMVKILQHFRLESCDRTENPPLLEKSLLTKPVNGMFLKLVSRDSRR
ncbi:cytochrome P450 3A24-like [Mercenaria mercenaria]|uniref:cytochrome P450 3A24-like n=1 Tax=Mercenaria mercenaria TaxID=6596 RepID=UPI00234F1540|nr:cytochrome P450 3A24-like [Mercenaria mercenaria]